MEFAYEAAKYRMATLRIGKEYGVSLIVQPDMETLELDGEQQRQENLIRLAAWIDLNSKVSVGCAGSILAYLQRQKAAEYLPGDPRITSPGIASVEMFTLKETM